MGLSGIHASRTSSKNRGILSVLVQLVVAGSFVVLFNITTAAAATVPAVLVFGDSLVDTGNNNYVPTAIAKANFEPYGRDFPGGTATGRFSNGRILPDFIAEMLGVKPLLPPYKDPTLQPAELLTGVSFGSAGAGYDNVTSHLRGSIPILEQLEMYKEYKSKITATVGKERADNITSTSPHMIVLGSNDMANPVRRTQLSITAHTNLLVKLARVVFQKLYDLGARKIGVVGAAPIGCVPLQRVTGDGLLILERNCAEDVNGRAKLFNSKLLPVISSLNQQLPDAKFVYFDIYNPLLSLILNPAPHGFEVVKKGCCGTGNIELGILCVVPGTCPDATKYVFWDSVHPGEKAHKQSNLHCFKFRPTIGLTIK